MYRTLTASALFALAAPLSALADTSTDIQALRQELSDLRQDYDARIRTLEQRLLAAQSTAALPTPPPTPPPSPPLAPPSATATATAAPAASGQSGANAFNPAVSLILSGLYTRTSQDPAKYAIKGFLLPTQGEVGPGPRGLSLTESELSLSASIDPWWRGATTIAMHGDNSVSVEEAFVQTTSLGNGLMVKAGRYFSGVGYLNAQHAHAWDFVDNPLAYQALLGTQLADDGVQIKWLAPTDLFIELGAELGRGRSYPGSDSARNGAGMVALTAHAGGDLGISHSWRAGVSLLNAKASELLLQGLASNGATVDSAFTGSTRVAVVDAVWKWAPQGNATRTNFKLQGEYLRSTRTGMLAFDPAGINSLASHRSVSSGWYVQGIYQFMPRWRVGLRTEGLDAHRVNDGANADLFSVSASRPRKNSLMLDFNASEFSRIRLQIAQDRSRPGAADQQLFLQYQMSLGAHGAHGY